MLLHRFGPLVVLFGLVLALLTPPIAEAAAGDSGSRCATPRQAVQSWIKNLQSNSFDSAAATACFDFSNGPEGEEAQLQVARDLLSVLDGQGKFVVYNKIPVDPDYRDPSSSLATYTLFPTLPDITLEHVEDSWLVSTRSVEASKGLFRATFVIPLDRFAQRLPQQLQGTVLGIDSWRLVGLALVIALAFLLGKVLELTLVGLLRRSLQRSLGLWNQQFEKKLVRRLNLFLTAAIANILIPNLGLPVRLNQGLLVVTKLLLSVGAVLIVTTLLDLLFDSWGRMADRTDTKMDDQLIPLLRRAARSIIYVVGLLFILQNMDVDVGSLLAGLGIGGLAFALAAKDTLANLFGSVTIFTDRPFQIGDYVSVAGVEGSIEEVGFRSTRVRTGADSVVTIPNSAIANSTIDNLGRRRCRRYKTQLGLTYDASPEQIEAFVEGVRASILASPFTQKHRFDVALHSFGPSELNIFVNLYFDTESFGEELKGRHHLHLEWLRLADQLGVGFAFPTQTLHVDTLGPQGRAPLEPAPESFPEVIRSFGPGGSNARPETPSFTQEFWPEESKDEDE